MHTLRTTLVLLAALFCGPAFAEDTSTNDGVAQDDGDDDLGDILNALGNTPGPSGLVCAAPTATNCVAS